MHGPTCIFWANLTPFSLQGGNLYVYGAKSDLDEAGEYVTGRKR
jgi:hypothetical protein